MLATQASPPERFVVGAPRPVESPGEVWTNPPHSLVAADRTAIELGHPSASTLTGRGGRVVDRVLTYLEFELGGATINVFAECPRIFGTRSYAPIEREAGSF